jgi:hypothetical protein
MLNMRGTMAVALSLLASHLAATSARAECSELEGTPPKVLLAYLDGDRSTLTQTCILFALDQLAPAKYQPAIAVLTRYLDYKAPDPPRSPEGFVQRHVPWLGDRYPAAKALLALDKAAAPGMISAIADPTTPELVRSNAVEMMILIYRDNPPDGAKVLNTAARTVSRADSEQRLLDAARTLAERCHPDLRGLCLSNALK